jgi:hypothetical protein
LLISKTLTSGGLTQKDEIVTWDVGEKVNNTVLFGLYLGLLRAKGIPPSNFYGLLPVHPVAAVLGCA